MRSNNNNLHRPIFTLQTTAYAARKIILTGTMDPIKAPDVPRARLAHTAALPSAGNTWSVSAHCQSLTPTLAQIVLTLIEMTIVVQLLVEAAIRPPDVRTTPE